MREHEIRSVVKLPQKDFQVDYSKGENWGTMRQRNVCSKLSFGMALAKEVRSHGHLNESDGTNLVSLKCKNLRNRTGKCKKTIKKLASTKGLGQQKFKMR